MKIILKALVIFTICIIIESLRQPISYLESNRFSQKNTQNEQTVQSNAEVGPGQQVQNTDGSNVLVPVAAGIGGEGYL